MFTNEGHGIMFVQVETRIKTNYSRSSQLYKKRGEKNGRQINYYNLVVTLFYLKCFYGL